MKKGINHDFMKYSQTPLPPKKIWRKMRKPYSPSKLPRVLVVADGAFAFQSYHSAVYTDFYTCNEHILEGATIPILNIL